MPRELETDCLIIGAGLAGLTAAKELSEAGVRTVVLSAGPTFKESNTFYAQGGILFESHEPDSKKVIEDILEAGGYLNYRPAVEQLARLGPGLVRDILIDQLKVPFDRNAEGRLERTREAAHSTSRILHRGDESGKAIQETFLDYIQTLPNVAFISSTTALNLLMTSFHSTDRSLLHAPARCFGAFVFDQSKQEVYPIFAKHTVIATGGVGQLFLHNTNNRFARGDGLALAYRAGCRLENLEYIQFHPTTFFGLRSPRFLISEALRGEGAVLLNEQGERFAQKYLPDYKTPELAPRDKLAQAIHQEMLATGAASVFLDMSHRPASWVQERFPFVYRNCMRYGVDPTKQPIPVVPGAHYHCGGIWTDLEGRTSLPNLWAVGEVACTGVHGANRLASTSLLEGLVWGSQAGKGVGAALRECTHYERPEIYPWRLEGEKVDPSFLRQDWITLKHTMWNYVGLIKTKARLDRAAGILGELARGTDVFYQKALLSDELIGLRHAVLASQLILGACQRSPRSQGCYMRQDLEI